MYRVRSCPCVFLQARSAAKFLPRQLSAVSSSLSLSQCVVLRGVALRGQVRRQSSYQSDLKDILSDLVPRTQTEVKEFRSQHGSKVAGEVTVDMVRRCWW